MGPGVEWLNILVLPGLYFVIKIANTQRIYRASIPLERGGVKKKEVPEASRFNRRG